MIKPSLVSLLCYRFFLIFRIAFSIGRYYDEEVHLPRDSKQTRNEENTDENNSTYFWGILGICGFVHRLK